jgi:hypothetical protein
MPEVLVLVGEVISPTLFISTMIMEIELKGYSKHKKSFNRE